MKKDEIKQLIDINSNNPDSAKKIVDKMKSIFDSEKNNLTDTERKSIFTEALFTVMNIDEENTTDYKDIDIDEIIKTSSVKSNKKKSKAEYEKQHDKNAQRILQEDAEIQVTMEQEILPVGIVFKSEISDVKREKFISICQIYGIKTVIIENSQDLENFKNNSEETL